jgi:hypothetical protein
VQVRAAQEAVECLHCLLRTTSWSPPDWPRQMAVFATASPAVSQVGTNAEAIVPLSSAYIQKGTTGGSLIARDYID